MFSYNENVMKAHFVIKLIAQLIMQLLKHYEKTKGTFSTIADLGTKIEEVLRNNVLSATNLKDIMGSFQIRKDISY